MNLKKKYLNSPDSIPDESMKTLWELAIIGKLNLNIDIESLLRATDYIKKNDITFSLKNLIINSLSPRILIKEHPKYKSKLCNTKNKRKINEIVDATVVINNMAINFLESMNNAPQWKKDLPNLILDFTLLLKETFDLRTLLNNITINSDYSCININTIENIEISNLYESNSWVALVKIVRDSWIELKKINQPYSNSIIKLWWSYPYPIFKRLTFFALAKSDNLDFNYLIQLFEENNYKWFWSIETQFEVLQILKIIVKNNDKEQIRLIEQSIFIENPKKNFSNYIEPLKIDEYYDKSIWLRLGIMKKEQANCLSTKANKKFMDIVEKYNLTENIDQINEYPMKITAEIGSDLICNKLPKNEDELYEFIINNQERTVIETNDDWNSCCKEDIDLVITVLLKLTKNGYDSFDWWDSALINWSTEKEIDKSWTILANRFSKFSENFFSNCSYSLSRWLQAKSQIQINNDQIFFTLINKTIKYSPDDNNYKDCFVTSALNNSVGICTSALQNWWLNNNPKINDLLPKDLIPIYKEICTSKISKFTDGKVILASNLLFLFQVDNHWTKENLIPLFDWNKNQTYATAVWQAFMWNPRITIPLLKEIKYMLLDTANYYRTLNSGATNYIKIITKFGIDKPDTFTYKEIEKVISKLDSSGLQTVSDFMLKTIDESKESLEQIWNLKLKKFFHNCWPKSSEYIDKGISKNLALICIKSESIFEDVYNEINFYINAINDPTYVLIQLNKSQVCEKFPLKALNLIRKLVDLNNKLYIQNDLKACLEKIIEHSPNLESNKKYKELILYVK